MSFMKKLILVIIFGCTISTSSWSGGQNTTKTYVDQRVQFSYPLNRYSKVNTSDTLQDRFFAYFLQIKNEDVADSITVCMKNIQDCGTNMGMVQPYWYSEDGTLMLFSTTTAVKTRKTASGDVIFEAFPACPAKDREGSSAYAGDCYMLVKAEKNRTLSITYWIGPASLHLSKAQAVKDATLILNSVRIR